MPEDEREGVWDIKRGDTRARGAEQRSVRSPGGKGKTGRRTGEAGERAREGTSEHVEIKKKKKQHFFFFLPVMCLRGREIGGGTGVLLHENSVQKDLRKGRGRSDI